MGDANVRRPRRSRASGLTAAAIALAATSAAWASSSPPTQVPEPSSLVLLTTGLGVPAAIAGWACWRRRRC